MSSKYVNLVGQKFSRLTVINRAPKRKEFASRSARWNCICECGKQHETSTLCLKRRLVQSCGCLVKDTNTKHGLWRSYLYRIHDSAKRRCNNPTHASYADYGGRGIEYRFASVSELAAELGERPSNEHSIDRIDNDGHYEVGNVRWATRSTQNKNKRKRTPKQMAHLDRAREIRWGKPRNYKMTRGAIYMRNKRAKLAAAERPVPGIIESIHACADVTNKDVLTLVEAADFLRCHPKTLRKMAVRGKVPARRIGSHWRFSRTRLTEWLQQDDIAA